jgi:sulfoxide reductase heme-binding subunit YedZ
VKPVRRRTPPGIIAAKTLVHLLALAPAAWLAWQIRLEVLGGQSGLGADPVAEIEHRLGLWALRLLMITLAITPLRQLTGQAVLVRFRRLLGLYAFAYATVHLSAYLVLDLRGYWAQIFEEIAKRPYITVGFLAWLLLVPLAATSTTAAIRRLGRNWARLHRLVYAVGVLAVLHFWWLVKSDVREAALYAAILAHCWVGAR